MEYIIILSLTLLNGLFAMTEIALVSSSKFKLEGKAKKGNKGAAMALELMASPTRLLSTVQIGITLIGILLGIYSGEKLTSGLQHFLEQIDIIRPYANSIAIGLVVLGITFVSIVLGELLPKRIGMTFPETVATWLSRPMDILSKVAAPFVWLLSHTNELLLRLLGIKTNKSGIVTEEEIKSIIEKSTESGEIQQIEQTIVERVFAMGDRKVSALMTHRSELDWLDLAADLSSIRKMVAAKPHSFYPVANQELDEILGIVSIKKLFSLPQDKEFKLKTHLQQPIFVPVTSSAFKLLEEFRKHRQHIAIVMDEYGSVEGLVTMDDIVDALVGDTSSIESGEYPIIKQRDGSWLIDGQYPFFEFVRHFEIENIPDDHPEFNTVGGFLAYDFHRIPLVGDKIVWHGYSLEILEVDGHRVAKIRVKPIKPK
ncbi:MAG: hemolysin family protein [Saprospiraceae bacterium]|nr:hemolysin family protein [Saprospiraceae bacterium]